MDTFVAAVWQVEGGPAAVVGIQPRTQGAGEVASIEDTASDHVRTALDPDASERRTKLKRV